MKKLSALCLLLLIAGCSTGVVPIGDDTYMISRRSAQLGCGAPVKAKGAVYREANEFCARQNKVLETIDIEIQNSLPARPGSVSLTFKCVPKK